MKLICFIPLFTIGTTIFSEELKFEYPLRIHGEKGKCREDSLDCIIWIGLAMPFTIVDTILAKPFFKSKDIQIESENEKYYPSAASATKKLNSKVEVDLYNIVGADTFKIKTFYFTVRRVPDPQFYINGKLINNSISRGSLLRCGRIDISLGCALDTFIKFKLNSFDLEIDGKFFHSASNTLTTSMIYYLTHTTGNKIRIMHDKVAMVKSDGVERYIYRDKTFVLEK